MTDLPKSAHSSADFGGFASQTQQERTTSDRSISFDSFRFNFATSGFLLNVHLESPLPFREEKSLLKIGPDFIISIKRAKRLKSVLSFSRSAMSTSRVLDVLRSVLISESSCSISSAFSEIADTIAVKLLFSERWLNLTVNFNDD